MTYSQKVYGPRQPIRKCKVLPPNWRDGWSWPSKWAPYGKCTGVYGYTLNRTYDES